MSQKTIYSEHSFKEENHDREVNNAGHSSSDSNYLITTQNNQSRDQSEENYNQCVSFPAKKRNRIQLQYLDTIIKTCKTLKLLKPDSITLVNNWDNIKNKHKKTISYLYWTNSNDFEQLRSVKYTKNRVLGVVEEEDIKLLCKKGFITEPPKVKKKHILDECIKLLSLAKLKEIFKVVGLKVPIQPKRKDFKDAIGRITSPERRQKLCDRLKYTLKRSYKLSELAKKTFFEINVLMHLGTLGQPLYEAPATKYVNNKPKLVFTSNVDIKRYLDNDLNDVDDDVEIFQTRDEFLGYIDAYNYTNDIFDKPSQVEVLKTLQKLKDLDGEQVKRFENQPWLCIFTPAYCYMEILDEAVKHLENYDDLLKALDCLIDQNFFRREKEIEWRKLKTDVLKKLEKSEEASRNEEKLDDSISGNLDPNDYLDEADKIYIDQKIEKWHPRARNTYIIQKENGEQEKVTAEVYCIYHFKDKFPDGEHWEGRWVRDAFLLLFWDIIHTKPEGVVGVFLTPGQKYPLDMFSEHFYKNRKASIDNRLLFIKNSDTSAIIKEMEDKLKLLKQQRTKEANNLQSTMIDWKFFLPVVQCLGAPALAAICERLAHNLAYWLGFPDLTLWNEKASDPKDKIRFVEVKTNRVEAQQNQLQWLKYLRENKMNAGLWCIFVNDNEADITDEHGVCTDSVEDI